MAHFHRKEPQRPLVVCIGFLGSKPRYIQKYADLLTATRVDVAPLTSAEPIYTTPEVLQYIPPMETFFHPSKHDQAAGALMQRIAQALATPQPVNPPTKRNWRWSKEPRHLVPEKILNDPQYYQPRKVMFFCLSNNGAYGYANLLHYTKRTNQALYDQINRQTAGVIWDSSPSLPDLGVFKRGFTSAICSMLGQGTQAEHPIVTPIVENVAGWLLKTKRFKAATEKIQHELQECVPYHAPQLYLVSAADDLVLAADTKTYLTQRAANVKHFFNRFDNVDKIHNALQSPPTGVAVPAQGAQMDAIATTTAQVNQLVNAQHTAQHADPVRHQLNNLYHYNFQQHVLPSVDVPLSQNAPHHHLPHFHNVLQRSELKTEPSHYFHPHYKRQLLHPAVDPPHTAAEHARQQYETIKPLFTKTQQFDDFHTHFLYDFHDSGHVQHIRHYPKEYAELVGAFCNYAFRG